MKGEALWPGHPSVALTPPPSLPGTSHQVCGTACAQDGDKFHLISSTNLLTRCMEILVLRHSQQASEGEQGGTHPPARFCSLFYRLFDGELAIPGRLHPPLSNRARSYSKKPFPPGLCSASLLGASMHSASRQAYRELNITPPFGAQSLGFVSGSCQDSLADPHPSLSLPNTLSFLLRYWTVKACRELSWVVA